jgi:hypothetical protein
MASLREQVAINTVDVLKEIDDPHVVLVTREPFDVEKLAITQFPALLVQQTTETRETITMGTPGVGRRMGVMTFEIRGFVRGTELDSRRNELIEAVEKELDSDRYRGLLATGVTDSQLVSIEIVPRLQPLAEFIITVEVTYNYLRGTP